ncbi:MAG: MFS transporter [Polyangia bacterium]
MTPLSPYHRRLFAFLSVASFFEGFDFMALGQLLPEVRAEMGLSVAHGGLLIGLINVGMILSYFLIRYADVWGRRRVMALTIFGYTLTSILTGLAPNVFLFCAAQLLARMFQMTELAVAMVYAAEEYPAERRGTVIGVIQACAGVGAVVCAAVVPALVHTRLGWRSVYFVGGVPLLLVAFLRRNLAETSRFAAILKERQARGERPSLLPVTHLLDSQYRKRLLQLACIWGLTFFCTQSAFLFWKEFALAERGLTVPQVGLSTTIAAALSMPLVFFAGKLLDRVGRRTGAALIFTLAAAGVYAAYSLHSRWALTAGLTLGILGTMATLPVLHAFTTELFPTAIRSDAYGWANNLLGRMAAVASPFVVGQLAERLGWGTAVSLTAISLLLALVLILVALPETSGRSLEETETIAR